MKLGHVNKGTKRRMAEGVNLERLNHATVPIDRCQSLILSVIDVLDILNVPDPLAVFNISILTRYSYLDKYRKKIRQSSHSHPVERAFSGACDVLCFQLRLPEPALQDNVADLVGVMNLVICCKDSIYTRYILSH